MAAPILCAQHPPLHLISQRDRLVLRLRVVLDRAVDESEEGALERRSLDALALLCVLVLRLEVVKVVRHPVAEDVDDAVADRLDDHPLVP